MVAGATGPRCGWCAQTETTIARQAFRIEALMDEIDDLQARCTELVADNRRLRLALGHKRPALAVLAPADREA
jgi:regulator of replication initiation timing